MFAHIIRVYRYLGVGAIRCVERNLIQHTLHNRLEAAGTDILNSFIETDRDICQ